MIFAGFFSCENSKKPDEIDHPVPNRKYDKPQDFSYSIWSLKNDSICRSFTTKFSNSEITTIVSLNRIDKNTLLRADTLIVPDVLDDDFLAYSPFPYTVKNLFEVSKIAIFSYPIQAYGLYEYGELIKWGPSSLGLEDSKTPTGLFFTNWKGEEVKSTVDDEWILRWNFNIENKKGVGWHQYELPGYPASHSCMRLLKNDAKWMYDWAEQWILNDVYALQAKGTPVIIYGWYNFDSQAPWLELVSHPKTNDISENDLSVLVSKYLLEILNEQMNRKKVLEERGVE